MAGGQLRPVSRALAAVVGIAFLAMAVVFGSSLAENGVDRDSLVFAVLAWLGFGVFLVRAAIRG